MESTPTTTPTPHDLDDTIVVTPDALERVREGFRANIDRYLGDRPRPRVAAADLVIELYPFSEVSSYPLYGASVRESTGAPPIFSAVVKFAPVFSVNNEGLTEYRHLATMWEHLGGDAGPLRVPRPLDFFEDVNALVMERVGGERFSRVLLHHSGRFSNRAAAVKMSDWARMCGQWLKEYHAATHAGSTAPFGRAFAGDIREKLEMFTGIGMSRDTSERVTRTVTALEAFGKTVIVPVADKHGDYGPQNVHSGDGFIYVFDLNYHVSAPVYDDIVYFLVTLETLNPFPRQLFLDRRRVMALREPFLAGYFGAPPTREQTALIEGYYLKALFFRCAKQRRNTAKRGAFALRLFDALRVRGYYSKRLVEQCDRVVRLLHPAKGDA